MVRSIFKLFALAGITGILIVASWDVGNFGLSYGANPPLPHWIWIDFFVTKPTPPPTPGLIDLIFAASLSPMPGVLSPPDLIVALVALVLLLLWLEGRSRKPRNEPGRARKVVSKYGVFYVWEGVAAHRARHRP